jgi:S-formylglutathione hydrolase FrmB
VKTARWLTPLFGVLVLLAPARATIIPHLCELDRINRRLAGQVLDFTRHHGRDRRIWSEALQEKRELYVYLPPHFDPKKQYPLIFWLHGFAQDEHSFLEYVVEPLDQAMASGKLPPAIVVAPDGSLSGRASITFLSAGSFFVNSKAGNFEDYLMVDVWDFLFQHFPIRPEREAHVMAGVSMGGGAAFHSAIKYRDRVGVAVAFMPPLNTRWEDCHGRYMSDFDPDCWGWRTDFSRGHEVVGRFYGVVTIRLKRVFDPLYDRRDPMETVKISEENPVEMLERYDIKPGELEMCVAYGRKDQFNLAAQVESFLYVAEQRRLCVHVCCDPKGKHDFPTAERLFPCVLKWLAPRLEPYAPPCDP